MQDLFSNAGETEQIPYNPAEVIGQSSGVAFLMHEPNSFAYWSYDARNIKPGAMTEIKMSIEKVEKLSSPYGTCDKNKDIESVSYLNTTYKYSWMLCFDMCVSKV